MGTAVSNPASFSSLRAACSAEGYGSSTNLSGYNRGGGIVPDHANTAGVSATDAGLALSQFNGVTIPTPTGSHHSSSISPASVSGYGSTGSSGGNVAVTTDAATVSTSGGVGPFTYSWAHVSGDTFTVNSASSASTTFSKTMAAPSIDGTSNISSGVYRCTITDTGDSSYQTTKDVTVTTEHAYNFV